MDNRLSIIFEAVNKAHAVVQELERDLSGVSRSQKSLAQETERASNNMSKMVSVARQLAGVLGIGLTATAMVQMSKMSAVLQAQEGAFKSLAAQAGVSSEQWFRAMDKAAEGTLSRSQMISVSTRSMSSGLKLSTEQMTQLMGIAKDRAAAFGTDTAEAFNTITMAIALQYPRYLRQLGITINLEEAYDKFARSLGTTKDKLNEAGQQQAILNAITEDAARTATNLSGESAVANDRFERMNAGTQNLASALGDLLVPVMSRAAEGLGDFANALASAGKESENSIGWVEKAMLAWEKLSIIAEINTAKNNANTEATRIGASAEQRMAMEIAAGQKVLRSHGIEVQRGADYLDDYASRLRKVGNEASTLSRMSGVLPTIGGGFIKEQSAEEVAQMYLAAGRVAQKFLDDRKAEFQQYRDKILKIEQDLADAGAKRWEDIGKAQKDALKSSLQSEIRNAQQLTDIQESYNERIEEMMWGRNRTFRDFARDELRVAKDTAKEKQQIENDFQQSMAGLEKDTNKKQVEIDKRTIEKQNDLEVRLNQDLTDAKTESAVAAAYAMYRARREELGQETQAAIAEMKEEQTARAQEIEERRSQRQQEFNERQQERAEELRQRKADELEVFGHQMELMNKATQKQLENADQQFKEQKRQIDDTEKDRIAAINETADKEKTRLTSLKSEEEKLHRIRLTQISSAFALEMGNLLLVKTKEEQIKDAVDAINAAWQAGIPILNDVGGALERMRLTSLGINTGVPGQTDQPAPATPIPVQPGLTSLMPSPANPPFTKFGDPSAEEMFRYHFGSGGLARWWYENMGGSDNSPVNWGGANYLWPQFLTKWKAGGGLKEGGSFTVPSGFPDDTFPLRVSSGERVNVTPAGKSPGGQVIINLSFQSLVAPGDYEMQQVARRIIPYIRREEGRRV